MKERSDLNPSTWLRTMQYRWAPFAPAGRPGYERDRIDREERGEEDLVDSVEVSGQVGEEEARTLGRSGRER